ncbi:WS/DGAT domain-containing protein [Streptomyces sp. YIM S03343]
MFRQRLVNVFTSNLPGPAVPVSIAGAPVRELYQLGVAQGNVPLSVGVISYAGQLDLALVGDADAVPDLEVFAAGMAQRWSSFRHPRRPDRAARRVRPGWDGAERPGGPPEEHGPPLSHHPPRRQPSMRCWVQNDVRSVVVAACAAALNSAVVETPYQCEVA